MAEHLKGRTGQLNYIDGAIGAIFLYSEVLYPLARCLQIDQQFIPVVNNIVVEFVYQIRDCSFDLGNFSYTAFVQFAQSLAPEVATEHNPAKKLALDCAGKTPLVYTSHLFSPLAYKWKTSFNENAKNIIWCNEFPEFNHNEFIGWTSHPIDKPFCVINLRSNLDNPRINRRLDLTDRLLSGFRPQAHNLVLVGQSYIEQVINGAILGDMASIYLALLNGVDPTPVALVEKFKQELVK